jgi:hypothetical protein
MSTILSYQETKKVLIVWLRVADPEAHPIQFSEENDPLLPFGGVWN